LFLYYLLTNFVNLHILLIFYLENQKITNIHQVPLNYFCKYLFSKACFKICYFGLLAIMNIRQRFQNNYKEVNVVLENFERVSEI